MFKFASEAALSRMQPTPHAIRQAPHGASRLVQAMSAWSEETRRAPSRHCRGARVYDYDRTTTAMHEIEYLERHPPHPPPDQTGSALSSLADCRIELHTLLTIRSQCLN